MQRLHLNILCLCILYIQKYFFYPFLSIYLCIYPKYISYRKHVAVGFPSVS